MSAARRAAPKGGADRTGAAQRRTVITPFLGKRASVSVQANACAAGVTPEPKGDGGRVVQ
jgi:hypothetical protein